jgi:hypothetical protein
MNRAALVHYRLALDVAPAKPDVCGNSTPLARNPRNLRILKIDPKESALERGYTT